MWQVTGQSSFSQCEVTVFFAVVKYFEYKIAISANFVQTVKNFNGMLGNDTPNGQNGHY